MKSKIKKIVAAAMAVLTLSVGIVGATGCGYCAHNLEVHEKEASTCLEHGHGYSYTCTKCGKLFAYSEEKGLYEIAEAETLPLGGHTLPDIAEMEGKLGVRLKEGKTTAETLWDYEMTYKCALCENEVAVPEEHTAKILPPNINKKQPGGSGDAYRGTYMDDETSNPYTKVELLTATTPDEAIELDPYRYLYDANVRYDSYTKLYYGPSYKWVPAQGASQRFPLYIPFTAYETRYVYYVVKNVTDTTTDPIEIQWSIDGNAGNWSEKVTVNPGEVKVVPVKATEDSNINVQAQHIKVSNPNNPSKLGKKMTLEIAGMFYVPGTVNNLNISSEPEKLEYKAGEKFDPAGLKVYAGYTDEFLGKTVGLENLVFSCGDKPLTVDDKLITVSYGGMRASFNITVTEGANNG